MVRAYTYGIDLCICSPTYALDPAGKTTFFVYNQAKIECLPNEKISELKTELAKNEEENQALAAEVKSLTAGKAGPFRLE